MALTKVDDRGLKTPIDLQDNEQIRLGTGNDLEIYHDGGTASILKAKAGDQLSLQADTIWFRNAANSETTAKFLGNGAVELYYNNNKTFETKNAGCIITGGLDCGGATFSGAVNLPDNYVFSLGSSTDLQLYHNGSNSYISNRGAGLLVIEATTGEAGIVLTQNGSAALYYDSIKKFETTSTGVSVTGNVTATGSTNMIGDGSSTPIGTNATFRVANTGSNAAYSAFEAASSQGSIRLSNDGTFHVTGALTAASFSGDGIIPAGGIIIWSGAANAIPTGWVLCNGSNSTPDLRDRFVVGAGSTYSVGDTGGHTHINLTTSQLPAHDHTFSGSSSHTHTQSGGGTQDDGGSNVTGSVSGGTLNNISSTTVTISGTTSSVGSGSSVENRPPYYALCYIMKT